MESHKLIVKQATGVSKVGNSRQNKKDPKIIIGYS